MSEILARIRVRETHGIRRYLYPLKASLTLPESIDITTLGLVDVTTSGEIYAGGMPVPSQITISEDKKCRLDFAVSLEPLAEIELCLLSDYEAKTVDDPLHLDMSADNSLHSSQKQFAVTIGEDGNVHEIIYDNVAHLWGPTQIYRTDRTHRLYIRGLLGDSETAQKLHVTEVSRGGGTLAAWSQIQGTYDDGCKALIKTEITACKSWVTTEYRLKGLVEPERVFIYIPFQATSSRLIFDTGIGDGLYGKVSPAYVGLGWCKTGPPEDITEGYVMSFHGYNTKTGKNDYIVPIRAEDLNSHCWFHLIDDNKAIAVAITKLPAGCEGFNIRLYPTGGIEMAVTLKMESEGPAEFGVCYHFLNDVPAIAAATNPQSILLPPLVEVLPP